MDDEYEPVDWAEVESIEAAEAREASEHGAYAAVWPMRFNAPVTEAMREAAAASSRKR